MKYRGHWLNDVTYNVGDVFLNEEDGIVYHMIKECSAGTNPKDSRYFQRLNQNAADMIIMTADMFSELLDDAAAAKSAETAISALIAPEYTKTTYSKGALRTHSGKLYKAKQNIGTAENWTASHWEETTVFAELSAILTSIGTLNTNVTALQGVVFDDKTLVLASSTESSTKKWAVTVDDSDGLQVDEIVAEGGDT